MVGCCLRDAARLSHNAYFLIRYYGDLILGLQKEARRELRRLDEERKEQDDLVESLRDKIAALTVSSSPEEVAMYCDVKAVYSKPGRDLVPWGFLYML